MAIAGAGVLAGCAANPAPDLSGVTRAEPGFFAQLQRQRVSSDPSVQWYPVGPGMSGYNQEMWTHPEDPDVLFMGPDMHVSYGSWDGGESWQSIEDFDGTGRELKRLHDIAFSQQGPDFGMAIDWNGWLYRTQDRGRNWRKTSELSGDWTANGVDPYAPDSFRRGWYDEQIGTRLSVIAVDPSDDRNWYIGAGNFWDVKANHRSRAEPHGLRYDYVDYGYILKSSDGGQSWQKITNDLPATLEVGRIIVHPEHSDRLVMATSHGLMHSTDGGLSWDSEVAGLPHNLPRDLTLHRDPATGAVTLYLIEQTAFEPDGESIRSVGGVFVSNDFGRSWRDVTGNLPVDLSKLTYPAEINRYYRAVGHWLGIAPGEARQAYPALPEGALPVFNRIAVNPLDPDEIWVTYNKKHDRTFGPGDVWRTRDGGASWQVVARYGSYWEAGLDTDYWAARGNPVGANVDFAHVADYKAKQPALEGNRLLRIGADGAVYISIGQQTQVSSDKGASWTQIDDIVIDAAGSRWIGRGNSDLPGRVMVLDSGIPGRRLMASGEHGVWQTVPSATPFDPAAVTVEQIEGQVHIDGMVSVATLAVHPHAPCTIFATSWRQEHAGQLRMTSDCGQSWANIGTLFTPGIPDPDEPIGDTLGKGPPGLLPAHNSLLIDPVEPDNMYVAVTQEPFTEIYRAPRRAPGQGGFGVMLSRDGGRNWQVSNAGLHEGASIRRLAMDPANPRLLYAAANDRSGGLYRSDDAGESWSRIALPASITSVNNVFVDPANGALYIATGYAYDSTMEAGGAWRSRDGGTTWEKIFSAPLVTQIESSPLDPDLLVLTVYAELRAEVTFANPGVYLSRDGGATWAKINRNLGSHEKIIDAKPDPLDTRLIWSAGWGSGWSVGVIAD